MRKIRQLALGSGPLCIPSSPFRELHKGVDIFLKIRPLMKIFDQFLCLQSLFFGLRSPHFRCFANPQVGPLAKWVLRINPVCGEVEGGGEYDPLCRGMVEILENLADSQKKSFEIELDNFSHFLRTFDK